MDNPRLDPAVPTDATPTSEGVTDLRAGRGMALLRAQGGRVRHLAGTTYFIPSQTGRGGYFVDIGAGTCVCDDFVTRGLPCKHLWAAEYLAKGGVIPGPVAEPAKTSSPRRPTYKQNWPAYNAAQCEEKDVAARLLRSLCDGIQQPPRKPGPGRPRWLLSEVVFGAAMKVYSTSSGRRATSDIRACQERGLLACAPPYNTLFRYVEDPTLQPLLTKLVTESASPLIAIEREFATDSTGFSTSTFGRWFDEKYGGEKKMQRWIKVHATVGVVTKVITAVNVTESHEADCPQLQPLLAATRARGFSVRELSADKAYLSNDNLAAIEEAGAAPFIPFKSNSTSTGESEVWERLFHHFAANRPDFLAHYHKRSNVETAFSAVKAKFGGFLRSKELPALFNEALLKCLCFNLSRLVHAIRELKIEPKFWTPLPKAAEALEAAS